MMLENITRTDRQKRLYVQSLLPEQGNHLAKKDQLVISKNRITAATKIHRGPPIRHQRA